MTYHFLTQLARGLAGEAEIDRLFADFYTIVPATPAQQRREIDRIWHAKDGNRTHFVEYKTDEKAGRTGNAFIETVSVDTACKPGWATGSHADLLVYFVTDPQTVYLIRFARLRKELERWQATYPTKTVVNDGYKTRGLLVPLDELEVIADAVF